jgi:hypothetical protein
VTLASVRTEAYDPTAAAGGGQMLETQRETIQEVNRTIRAFGDDPRIPPEETWEFFCECGCFTLVELSLAAYDGGAGVWAPGHRPG